jgi:hypothetical protein
MANDSDITDDEVTDETSEDNTDGDPKDGGGPDSKSGDAKPEDDAARALAERPTPTPPSPIAPDPASDPAIDALMALVGETPDAGLPPPPVRSGPSSPPPPLPTPATTAPTPLPPRPPLPTEPMDMGDPGEEESPYSTRLDIPPPHSVPVPMPAPVPTVRPKAEVTDVSPDSGPTLGGTGVTLHGKHLYRVSIVRFGGELAQTIGAREPTEVKVLAPAAKSAGPVDVSVQNPSAEETTIPKAYTYKALPAPKISSVAPTYADAAGGTEISVIGKNFIAETKVLIGKEPAKKVVFIDATTLEVVLPGGDSGAMMDVAVENPDGKRDTVKRAFKYS